MLIYIIMITKRLLILVVLLVILTSGFLGREKVNWDFFTYNQQKCSAQIIDDCIKIVNKIDPNTKIRDLHPIDYAKLGTVIDLPKISQRDEKFSEEKVSDIIFLPIELNNNEIRERVAKEAAVGRITSSWCERPSFLK